MQQKNKEKQETSNFSQPCFLTLMNSQSGFIRVSMQPKILVKEVIERIYRTGSKDLHWIVDIDSSRPSELRNSGTINEPSFMVMVKGILKHSPLPPNESLMMVIEKFGLIGPEWEKFY